ncbi:unnamed protein product [Prorocentrum cordatum]|uniref:Uncharacterized protein n=1 Tax=Prorocentrum cordatum TaxID=2364126 RepID=A0ABN9QGT5_9DINO|nr:unnamed protein product [Polarella glacialis]
MCPEPVAKYLLEHREELHEGEGGDPRMSGERHCEDGSEGKGTGTAEGGPSAEEPAPPRPSARAERQLAAKISSPLVIGITGSTRSGKSTLAARFARAFGPDACAIVGQDDFRFPGADVPEDSWVEVDGVWLRNWETPSLTDWIAFEGAIQQAAATRRIVLAEGYSLLHSERVRRMLCGVIWVEIDELTCWQRRGHSYPQNWDRDAYFSQCIWSAHQRYRASVFDAKAGIAKAFVDRMLVVSGSEPLRALCSQALTSVQSWAAAGAPVDHHPVGDMPATLPQFRHPGGAVRRRERRSP